MILWRLALLLFLGLVPAGTLQARPIIADLAVRTIDIDHRFAGLDVLMFGARNDAGRIAVVVRGPEYSYRVWKKERVAGVWVNRRSMVFDHVVDFYTVAATTPLEQIQNDELLAALGIGPGYFDTLHTESTDSDVGVFRAALVRNKQHSGLYPRDIGPVSFWEQTLFRTILHFPKNISGGWYTVETYLFNDGLLSAVQTTPIHVRKTGFEALIYDLAHRHAWVYGLLCVIMALLFGWIASAVFGRI